MSFATGLGEGRSDILSCVTGRFQSVFEPLTGIVQELIDRVDIAAHAAGNLLYRHATQLGRQGHHCFSVNASSIKRLRASKSGVLFSVLGWTRGVVYVPRWRALAGSVMLSRETSCHFQANALMASRTVMAMAQVVNRLRPWN